MFHRELRINFGKLERAADALDWYGQMLTRLKEGMQLFENVIEDGEGEGCEALMRNVRRALDMIVRELAAVGDTRDILRSYIRDMTAVIAPDIWDLPMVVDRNDIWANLTTMAERIGHLACLPYYTSVCSINVCTLNPDARTRRAEEGYYRRVQKVLTEIVLPYFARIRSIFGELQQIYEEKVVTFENIDDEYLWIADSNYQKHQEFCDVLENAGMAFVDTVGDFVTGAVNGVWDTVAGGVAPTGGIVYPMAAGAVYAFCDKIDLEPPGWAREEIEKIQTNGGVLLKDPLLLVEGMAQGATDAIEQKGVAYCAGYIAGPIIASKGIAAGISKAKAVKNKARGGKARTAEDAGKAAESGINSVQNLLPNLEKATINPNKLTGYALNPEHPVGGNKAKVFESALGYNQSNAGGLMKQIYEKLPQNEAILGKFDQYGQRYTVDIPITGPNGNTVNVRTGWIIKTGSDVPELITIFIK